jgi:hypothetical protein
METTMSNVTISLVRAALAAAFLLTASLANAGTMQSTIAIKDPRPVAKALEELENRYGWQITYEDPPYVHGSDVADVTSLVRKNKSPAEEPKVLIPKGGTLSLTVPSAGWDENSAIEAVLKTYNTTRGGNRFASLSGVRLLHVVPRKMTGPSGKLETVTPILDTIITVAPKKRSAFELLQEVCDTVSASTKEKVVVGTTPINLMMNETTAIGGSNETARSVLERLVLGIDEPLSWQLFYDPGLKWYVVNIHVVPPPPKKQ